MATEDRDALRARVKQLLSRNDPVDDRELALLIEPRNLPGGRTVFVLRGSAKEINRIEADDYVSTRGIMDRKREAKRLKYLKKRNDPNYSGPIIVAEGDSWLEYPCAKDMVEWLNDEFAILSLAKAGDTWADILNQEGDQYPDGSPMGLFETIDAEKPDIVILSVGGNEIAGDIKQFVHRYRTGRPRDQYINDDFNLMLNYVQWTYTTIIQRILATNPRMRIILHSYDYPDPRSWWDGGQWIGGPLEAHRYIGDQTLWRQIVNMMLDRFAVRLETITSSFGGNVRFVRLLGIVGTSDYIHGPDRQLWRDEMHPNSDGFQRLAPKFREAILAP